MVAIGQYVAHRRLLNAPQASARTRRCAPRGLDGLYIGLLDHLSCYLGRAVLEHSSHPQWLRRGAEHRCRTGWHGPRIVVTLTRWGPDVTVTTDGLAHIVWIEGDEQVRYSYGQATSWSTPTTIATTRGYANGVRIAAELGKFLRVAWDEGHVLRATAGLARTQQWPESYEAIESNDLLRDVCLAPNPSGDVGLSWSQTSDTGHSSIVVSQREPIRSHRIWAPLLFRK